MTAVNIRAATSDDIEALTRLQLEFAPSGHSISIDTAVMLGRGYHVMVATEDKTITGYAIIQFHDRDPGLDADKKLAQLVEIFVAETHRQQGIGTALIEHVVTEARAAGCAQVFVVTAHHAATVRKLFTGLGWHERPGPPTERPVTCELELN